MPLPTDTKGLQYAAVVDPSNALNSHGSYGLARWFLTRLCGIILFAHYCWAGAVYFGMKHRGGVPAGM